MFLQRASIENFRGIVKLDIELDDTTVIIGENATGKTSLLAALAAVLGPATEDGACFRASDFRLDGVGPSGPPPIRVCVAFRERETGEWDPLDALLPAATTGADGLRHLILEVTGEADAGGPSRVEQRFLGLDGEPLAESADGGALAGLRRLSPLVLLRADRYAVGNARHADPPAAPPPHESELERRISAVYDQLIATDGVPSDAIVREGLAAASGLLAENAERVFRNPQDPARDLEELVEHPVVLSVTAGPELDAGLHGSGARSIALLLLLGAVLEARGDRALAPEAEAILAIEEPEVHLHPVLLAAVWSVISSLRAQKLITTNSGELAAASRLGTLRRLVRGSERTEVFRLQPDRLSLDEMRRMTYHVRLRRDDALFARAWLLVEGETEVWLFPEMARLLGVDFASEGIQCVEIAQAGVEPIVKLADDLGIPWHLVADGDLAGRTFAATAERHLVGRDRDAHITSIVVPDIERVLWDSGYSFVYHSIARGRSYVTRTAGGKSRKSPSRVIEQAIRNSSKPFLALTVVEQASLEDAPGVPDAIGAIIRTTVRLARGASGVPGSLGRFDSHEAGES